MCVCVVCVNTHTHTHILQCRDVGLVKETKIMGQQWMQCAIFGTRAIDSLAMVLSVYPAAALIV